MELSRSFRSFPGAGWVCIELAVAGAALVLGAVSEYLIPREFSHTYCEGLGPCTVPAPPPLHAWTPTTLGMLWVGAAALLMAGIGVSLLYTSIAADGFLPRSLSRGEAERARWTAWYTGWCVGSALFLFAIFESLLGRLTAGGIYPLLGGPLCVAVGLAAFFGGYRSALSGGRRHLGPHRAPPA